VSGSIGALLPTLKDRFDLNSIQAGGLVATIATSTALAQPVVGRLADLVGVRRVAGAGAVLSSALLALIGVAPQGFTGTTLGERPRVYVPISMRAPREAALAALIRPTVKGGTSTAAAAGPAIGMSASACVMSR